ncbi:hypothetical protein CFOL_v3_18189 [Cephalotus follicularis]|uniref:Gag-asp_proteas domain-containing protein n=1 Tax=Cephalotus follicularis TaxID=3775 RepID=A0A1Q3C3A6_CEPFO|nr:hypothetical protein CFOL_v3_18189 [Cephalotus follicularis]
MEERRMKNLCFWCDEKFVPGHKCKNRQVYMMEVKGVMEEEKEDKGEEYTEEGTNQQPQLSIHALTGSTGQQTMQLEAMVGKKHLQVLIDSGSTHNFLALGLAGKMGLPLIDIPKVTVKVANGEQLQCSKMIKKIK